MTSQRYYDQEFKALPKNELKKGTYENCTFSHCDFFEINLLDFVFSECEFNDCNLSSAKLTNTAFRDVQFNNCKLLGMSFEECNDFLFSIQATNSLFDFSSFYKKNLKKVKFNNCSFKEVDFSESDLSNTTLAQCELLGAVFDRTNLEKSDLRTAYNYIINPENNRISKAKFTLSGIAGLLVQHNIIIES